MKDWIILSVCIFCLLCILWFGGNMVYNAGWCEGYKKAWDGYEVGFEDGREYGVWMGRWEAYDLGFADGQKSVRDLSEGKVCLTPILNKEVRLRTLDK